MVPRGVRELRLLLCKGAPSEGAKQFIIEKYSAIKGANPKLPFLVREMSGVTPMLTARFDHGHEKAVPLAGLSSGDVAKKLAELKA